MLNWDVTEDDTPLPQSADTALTPPPHRWWLWVGMVLCIVAVSAGGVALSQRVQRGNDAMRADLLAFIRQEEQARRLGQQENANNFLPDDMISPDFAEAYARLFVVPPLPVGVAVTLEEFTVTGDTAQVVVGLGAQRQQRSYRLTAAGWRRVPLHQEWGEATTTTVGTGDIRITYRASDANFVRQLEADLPTLMNEFTGVGGYLDSPATIRIEPRELAPVLYQSSQSEDLFYLATVNSPRVVELPSYWTLSGEAAIRYKLAERLWAVSALTEDRFEGLPQAGQFIAASFQVRLLRWATMHEPTMYDALVASWRTTATAEGWRSPFDAGIAYDRALNPFAPTPAEARMLLVATTVVEQNQNSWLAFQDQLLSGQPTGWDTVFRLMAQQNTLEVEAQARRGAAPTVLPLPLTGRITTAGANAANTVVHMEVAGYDQPIVVEGVSDTSLTFVPPDGSAPLTLPASCLTLFPQATVQGTWREQGLRLAVNDITIDPTTFPPAFEHSAPPSDTVAYIATSETDPMSEHYTSIGAMNARGTVTSVLTSTEDDFAFYGPNSTGSLNGLFVLPRPLEPTCRVARVAWYDFARGIVGEWMFNWNPTTTNYYPILMWDDATNEGLLFLSTFDQVQPTPYWRLHPGDHRFLHQPDGKLPAGQLVEVRPGAQEVLLLREGRTSLQRVALESGVVLAAYSLPSGAYVTTATYSRDGATLLAAWARNNDAPGEVIRYDLHDDTATTVWHSPATPIYNLYPDAQLPRFYAQSQAVTIGDRAPRAYAQNDTVSIIAYAPLLVAIGESVVPLYTGAATDYVGQQFACRHGGLGFWMDAESSEPRTTRLDTPPTLRLVTVDGDPRYSPIPLPPMSFVLACE